MASKPKDSDLTINKLNEIAASLDHIKRLLVFSLVRDEASQDEIGTALGVDRSTVSRMLSAPKRTRKARK